MEPINQSLLEAAKIGQMWLAKWIADRDENDTSHLKIRAKNHLKRIDEAITNATK